MGLGAGSRRSARERGPHAGTKELLQVHQGAMTVEVGSQSVTLKAGELSRYRRCTHSYANPGAQQARFSLAVFEPGVGPGPGPRPGDD